MGRGSSFAHHDIDFAGGNRHDDALDGTDLLFCNLLFPGYAKVVIDSWPTFSSHGGSQADHRRFAAVEILFVANGIVEVAVSFMLFGGQHRLIAFHVSSANVFSL